MQNGSTIPSILRLHLRALVEWVLELRDVTATQAANIAELELLYGELQDEVATASDLLPCC